MTDIQQGRMKEEGNKLTLFLDVDSKRYYVMCERIGYSDVKLYCEKASEAISLFKALQAVTEVEID